MTWPRAIVLAAAIGFLGFSLAVFLGRDRPVSSSSVDVGFYQDMLYHHDQALQMAILELQNGEDPTVRHFAREVLTDQSMEIGIMQRSLAEWGKSSYDRPDQAMAWMGMPTPTDQMQGLQTEEQMDQLADARGEEADALFLEMMADHHVGGIHMAEYAAEHAESDYVRERAHIMAVNQSKEVNMYSVWAERLGLPVEIDRVPVPEGDSEDGEG